MPGFDSDTFDDDATALFSDTINYFACRYCHQIGRQLFECTKCRQVICQDCEQKQCCGQVAPIINEFVLEAHRSLQVSCKDCDEVHSMFAECEKQRFYCPNLCFTLDEPRHEEVALEVGPIWNNNEAAQKANAYKAKFPEFNNGFTFTGEWWTTVPGQMSAAKFRKNQATRDKIFCTFL